MNVFFVRGTDRCLDVTNNTRHDLVLLTHLFGREWTGYAKAGDKASTMSKELGVYR